MLQQFLLLKKWLKNALFVRVIRKQNAVNYQIASQKIIINIKQTQEIIYTYWIYQKLKYVFIGESLLFYTLSFSYNIIIILPFQQIFYYQMFIGIIMFMGFRSRYAYQIAELNNQIHNIFRRTFYVEIQWLTI